MDCVIKLSVPGDPPALRERIIATLESLGLDVEILCDGEGEPALVLSAVEKPIILPVEKPQE